MTKIDIHNGLYTYRIEWVDYMKAFSIIAMVLHHTPITPEVNAFVYLICLPAFFFIVNAFVYLICLPAFFFIYTICIFFMGLFLMAFMAPYLAKLW